MTVGLQTASRQVSPAIGGGLGALAAAWAAALALAISLGAFEWRLEALPDLPIGIAVAIAVPVVAAVVAYRSSASVAERTLSLDPRMVIAVQHARLIGLGFVFAWAYGELGAGFAWPAALGDIATGLAAYLVLLALLRGRLGRGHVICFTALGLGDFALAIVLGIALRPAALDVWPAAFYPAFAVPFFTIVHLVTIAQLRHGRLAR